MKAIFLALLFGTLAATAGNIDVFFSPKGGCTEAVVSNLNRATNSVLV
jgi:phosphatidylserine/phosphatidylglycerophosphate/cardiolipin synthase-like enzyme